MFRNEVKCGLLVVLMLCVFACHKDKPGDDPTIVENSRIDEWILENMQVYYLWNDHLPAKPDMTLEPSKFFESLLYREEDRFSTIVEDYQDLVGSFSGVTLEAGYDFSLFWLDAARTKIGGIVTYVKRGSPAEKAGLKRGLMFVAVNGKVMTVDNYIDLLNTELGKPHSLEVYNAYNDSFSTMQLDAVQFSENPIYLDTIYQVVNHKVGYLIYNFFAPDGGSGDNAYDKQLNDIFAKFKSENIDILILDLRYNGGGYISSANHLAGMISNCTSNDVFSITQYNSFLTNELKKDNPDFDKEYFEENIVRFNSKNQPIEAVPINHLGIKKMYVIATGSTASASELVINGLNPYLGDDNIIQVGETTVGKNVGGIALYEQNSETNKWGLYVMIFKTANSAGFGDYGNGFTPDIECNELDRFNDDVFEDGTVLRPLGDINEVMLQTALASIEGRTPARAHGNKPSRIVPFRKTSVRDNLIIDKSKVLNININSK